MKRTAERKSPTARWSSVVRLRTPNYYALPPTDESVGYYQSSARGLNYCDLCTKLKTTMGNDSLDSIGGRQHLNPSDLPNWSETFSQVVVVRTGSTHTIYVSGQVSVDAQNNVIGHGDLARQAEVALQNLSKALAAAGATPADVVRLGIYIKNYHQDQASMISAALRRMFVAGQMPASTWLGVASLALDELLIEIEATAVITTTV